MTAASPARASGARRRTGREVGQTLGRVLPPLLVLVAAIVIWEVATAGTGRRVIPPPSAILDAMGREQELLLKAALATFTEAIGGLLIGTLAGIVIGFATARWAIARDILVPLAVGASTIPLIAIAPVIGNWFGVLNPLSKMMMAALLVFFPVVINVIRGLVEVHPSQLELMRSYAASETVVLRKVRVPNMLPFLFTALKVAATLAFIGAIVAEYFGGTSAVIGRVVLTSMSSGSFDLAWAGILIGAIGALAAYIVVVLVERLVIPWSPSLHA